MESLRLDTLENYKIMAQERSKSIFVPFINMVPRIPPITPAPRTTPIKHLCESKMREHRKKWICYNCYEKFTQGHRCAKKNLYLLYVDYPPAPDISDDVQEPVDDRGDNQELPVDPLAQDNQEDISLHALAIVTTL